MMRREVGETGETLPGSRSSCAMSSWQGPLGERRFTLGAHELGCRIGIDEAQGYALGAPEPVESALPAPA